MCEEAASESAQNEELPLVSRETLLSVMTLSPDALVVIDQSGIIRVVNEQSSQLFHYQAQELSGKPLETLLPVRFHHKHILHRERYLAAPHQRPMGQELDLYGRRKDGSDFPVDISLRPLLLEGKMHVIAAIRDVTTQRMAEHERLLQAERLSILNDFLNQAHDAMLILDPIGRVTSWNQSAEKLYGWSAQEAFGRIAHLLLKTRFPKNRLMIEVQLEQDGQWRGELVNSHHDGQHVLVESHRLLLRGEGGRPTAILVMDHAISKRHPVVKIQKSQANIAAELAFFQQIIDMLPSSMYIVRGPEARLLLANRATDAVWGAHWLPGQAMQDFLTTQGITIIDEQGRALPPKQWATRRAVQQRETVRYHQEIIHQPNGTQLPVLIHAVPLQPNSVWQEAERIEEQLALVMHQDVTPLKEIEYVKDEFIGVAAHELRAPLTILKGAVTMLKVQTERGHGTTLADWQQEALQEIELATDRLTTLTELLLDVTRLQAGKIHLHLQSTDLLLLIQQVVSYMQPGNSQHILEIKRTEEHLTVLLDRERIEQVLINLIDNAIKYSPQGGVIILTAWAEGGEVGVSVEDKGMGIPLYQQAQIFGRFVRADNARAAGIAGTGLGLYLCREFVECHGGRLWFQSSEGQGSTFFLALPALPHPDAPAE